MNDDKCIHDKQFSGITLLTARPQYPWVCKKCGEHGRDIGEMPERVNEFDRIMKEIHNNINKEK